MRVFLLRDFNELGNILGFKGRVSRQDHGRVTDLGDGRQIFEHIEWRFGDHHRVGDQGAIKAQQQGVAVGCGGGDGHGAYHPRSPRLVVNHDALAQLRAQGFTDGPRPRVGKATGRVGDNDLEGLYGEIGGAVLSLDIHEACHSKEHHEPKDPAALQAPPRQKAHGSVHLGLRKGHLYRHAADFDLGVMMGDK